MIISLRGASRNPVPETKYAISFELLAYRPCSFPIYVPLIAPVILLGEWLSWTVSEQGAAFAPLRHRSPRHGVNERDDDPDPGEDVENREDLAGWGVRHEVAISDGR